MHYKVTLIPTVDLERTAWSVEGVGATALDALYAAADALGARLGLATLYLHGALKEYAIAMLERNQHTCIVSVNAGLIVEIWGELISGYDLAVVRANPEHFEAGKITKMLEIGNVIIAAYMPHDKRFPTPLYWLWVNGQSQGACSTLYRAVLLGICKDAQPSDGAVLANSLYRMLALD